MSSHIAELLALAFVRTIIIFSALILPDVVFIGKTLLSAGQKKVLRNAALLFAASLMLALGSPNWVVGLVLILLFALSLAWHLTFAYFGNAMRPELVILFAKPDHFADAVAATKDDMRRLAPVAIVILASMISTLTALSFIPAPQTPISAYSPFVAVVIFICIGLQGGLHRNDIVVYPSLSMLGPIGTIYAIARAINWTVRDQFSAPPIRNSSLTYSYDSLDENPVTVAVLMGEGIAARRMSIYNGVEGTTPRLEKRVSAAGEFALLVNEGFSLGSASNSSIAAFLSGSPFPERRGDARSLFQIAKRQGFESYYLSGQKRSPLDLTAGASDVTHVATPETLTAVAETNKDWALLDILARAPVNNRSFFFIYPRVNHAPYYCYQRDGNESYFAHPGNSEELVHNYDVGIRSFDHFTDELLSAIESRPGAVFAFITSDHNEFLGENGVVGHNVSESLESAMVPVMLYTNRPEIANAFRGLRKPDAFQIVRLVLASMGTAVHVEPFDEQVFYVNNALPFGRAGYISVERTSDPAEFAVTTHDRKGVSGKILSVRYGT